MRITITPNMLGELHGSERDPFRDDHGERLEHVRMAFCWSCGGRPDLERDAMITAIEKADTRSKRPVITVTEFQVPAWIYALYYDMDKWGDWGREGTPYVTAARRMLREIRAEFPEAYDTAIRREQALRAAW
tara:strand:+ start:649 stop:1044 length:396 start_codon:yes stop_codon:yes gene_type:complete